MSDSTSHRREESTVQLAQRPCTGPVRVEVAGRPTPSPRLRPGKAWIIGRGAGVDLCVADLSVSGEHCRLEHHGEEVTVVDLDSRNGVWLDGARVKRAVLPPGGGFQIGKSAVRIIVAEGRSRPLPGMIGESGAMHRLASMVRRTARLRVPILVSGESGTGKELVARAIHDHSGVVDGPFVAINAASLSPELAGSELFGHRRGAFTGAWRNREGAFRRADGGTLFIDEVAVLQPPVQAKLLRVLEDGAVTPVGADEPGAVTVRVVAATCEPIEQMVEQRTFRLDLYQRLAVCVIRVPPLQERGEDIPALARHLLGSSEVEGCSLTTGAVAELREHHWPGNVRELRNVLVQSAMRANGGVIRSADVAAVLSDRRAATSSAKARLQPGSAIRLLAEEGGNISAAARRARMARSTFRDLLRAPAAPSRSFD